MHRPDDLICWCGYVREDVAKQILEDRRKAEENKRRKKWQRKSR
jgi:hypothetical protein